MIIGIGIDLVEIKRIEQLIERNDRFSRRILTERELDQYLKLSDRRKIEFLAGRFSAKEALSKAMGTGIGKEFSFHDMTVENDDKGRPYFTVEKIKGKKIHLSITHTKEYAAAQVIVEE